MPGSAAEAPILATMTRFGLRRRAVVERLRRVKEEAERPPQILVRTVRESRPPDKDRHAVPKTVRDAADWSWRFLVITAAILVILKGLSMVSTVVIPIIVATLLAALLQPLYNLFARAVPRTLAAGLTLITLIAALSTIFALVGRTLSAGLGDMTDQVLQGIESIRAWVRNTFGITNVQIDEYLARAREAVTENAGEGAGPILAQIGLTAGHFIAGFFIALFALFFLLYDGPRIWGWVVRFFPDSARSSVHEAGQIAWAQLSSFTRATMVVALVDAIGITLVAVLLNVPFPVIIFALVFVGAFIPFIGSGISGSVAVLLALVAHGPVVALLMLAGVIAVQQIESHLLQPLLMGRVMKLHPLGVILAISAGVILAGIIGALIAVPIVAVLNAVGKYYLAAEDVTAADEALLTPEPVTDLPAERPEPAPGSTDEAR